MMEKAVMISIHPEWCEKIVNGSKTIEVRKTRPKLEPPFKCYIYCTKAPKGWYRFSSPPVQLDGHIIGEFVCDSIRCFDVPYPAFQAELDKQILEQSCLTYYQLHLYAYHDNLYSWNITNLKIYDKPRQLSEFSFYNCSVKWEDGYPMPTHEIKRPPQSWCYVGEVE